MATTTELSNWLNGTPTGGPNGDGYYPLTKSDSTVVLVPCPALGVTPDSVDLIFGLLAFKDQVDWNTDVINKPASGGAGSGSVTSVQILSTTGLSFTGGPITGAGTFTPTLSANLQAWSGVTTASKANLASPAFTGTPTGATAARSVNTTQLATTAFVKSLFGANSTAGVTDWNDVTNTTPGCGITLLLGTAPNGPGEAAYFHTLNFEYNSKGGTGNLTQLAIPYNTSRVYIRYRYSSAWSAWSEFSMKGHTHVIADITGLQTILDSIATKAPLLSPTFTGTPLVPTAAIGTNTTQAASTAFVVAEIGSRAPTKTGTGASGTWPVSVTGNAATATILAAARTIALSGAATGTATAFNGSANITIPVTALNATNLSAGTVPDARLSGTYNNAVVLWANISGRPVLVTSLLDGLMSAADKAKLDTIASDSNNYTHPATHPATMIVEDSTHRFFTDTERTKLTGIESGANAYTHPATHPATMIVEDSTHRFVTDAEKSIWNSGTGGGGGGLGGWIKLNGATDLVANHAYMAYGAITLTLPATLIENQEFVIHAVNNEVTIDPNGTSIILVGEGYDLLLEPGDTVHLVVNEALTLEIV